MRYLLSIVSLTAISATSAHAQYDPKAFRDEATPIINAYEACVLSEASRIAKLKPDMKAEDIAQGVATSKCGVEEIKALEVRAIFKGDPSIKARLAQEVEIMIEMGTQQINKDRISGL